MRLALICFFIFNSLSAEVVGQVSPDLNILTWNVFLRPRNIFWGDGQIKRAKQIKSVLGKSDYDVIVLQEAFDKGSIRLMKEQLDEIYPYQMLPSKTKKGVLTNGVWLLSKHPITVRDSIFYTSAGHADKVSQKGAVFARIEKNGFVFDVVGTHAQAQESEKFSQIRAEQYGEIKTHLLNKHVTAGIPQFIIGDLNTDRKDSVNYDLMLATLDAEDGSVSIPDVVQKCDKHAHTWGCSKNELIPKRYRGRSELLDYVLVRNYDSGLSLDRKLVVQLYEEKNKSCNLSDHYGIEVRIEK